MAEDKKKPIENIKAGSIQVAIWENETKDEKNPRKFLSAVMTKSYKKGDEWKTTDSLNANDVPKAILALQKAYETMVLKQPSDDNSDN